MKKSFIALLCLLLVLLVLLPLQALATDFSDHPLTSAFHLGSCKTLAGNVEVVLVFVDAPGREWDADSQLQTFETILAGLDLLEQDAQQYGVSLRFTTKAYRSCIDILPTLSTDSAWMNDAVDAAKDMPPFSDPEKEEMSVYCQSGNPILFLFRGSERCFAVPGNTDYQEECLVLYADHLNTGTVRHELLHLYGAQDYYTPSGYKEAADALFPNSLMLSSEPNNKVDSLTAYLVGWCSKPDDAAAAFLEKTKSITSEDIAQGQESNQFSGYGEKQFDTYHYTGDLVNGLPHGEGTTLWEDGSRYEGHFVHGIRTGNGTFTWSDGNTYTGDFLDGELSGYGVFQWSSGIRYEGQFQNGEPSGLGTYIWSDGSLYRGEIAANQRSGHGYFRWSDGLEFYGDFTNGNPSGLGVMKWPEANGSPGEIYLGQFQGFDRTGFGTCLWSDGSIYSGQYTGGMRTGLGAMWWKGKNGVLGDAYLGDFQDGVRNGRGALRWENGDVYTGDFLDGIPSGNGTYVWADGSVLTGEFQNGSCNGYGVYVDTDGNVTVGYWSGGEYIGTEKP